MSDTALEFSGIASDDRLDRTQCMSLSFAPKREWFKKVNWFSSRVAVELSDRTHLEWMLHITLSYENISGSTKISKISIWRMT